jgi:hypothetical protein
MDPVALIRTFGNIVHLAGSNERVAAREPRFLADVRRCETMVRDSPRSAASVKSARIALADLELIEVIVAARRRRRFVLRHDVAAASSELRSYLPSMLRLCGDSSLREITTGPIGLWSAVRTTLIFPDDPQIRRNVPFQKCAQRLGA